ncbi:MAG: hypothetical protein AAGG68_02185 [Bacteroidota bacterium]
MNNPSFEDFPRHSHAPKGWYDCGFEDESPSDIHPEMNGGQFRVTTSAMQGNTYIGMVVRDNETWEAVAQRLSIPLKVGQCYNFSLKLARSMVYNSLSRVTNQEVNYATPVIVRIWGGKGYCDRAELLGKTSKITKTSWQEYAFTFMPEKDVSYIIIEAYYETTLFPYNGNVLIDDASPITSRPCTEEDKPSDKIAKAGEVYPTTQGKITRASNRIGTTNLISTQGITIKVHPEQSVSSVATALQKEFDELDITDNSQLLINVLVDSKEDRVACKKLLKEAMKTLKGTYKSYASQIIVSR